MNTVTIMNTDGIYNPGPLLRLLQLCSSNLPVGSFAWSQGLESAVEQGFITKELEVIAWAESLLYGSQARLDLPVLLRLYNAADRSDLESFRHWGAYLYASRETSELRLEESTRARALTTLLSDLNMEGVDAWRSSLEQSHASVYAFAASQWGVSCRDSLAGYAFGWLENLIVAAIKLVPLGQTAGQRLQLALTPAIDRAISTAMELGDTQIGASAPALAIASSNHETQYSRLFRS